MKDNLRTYAPFLIALGTLLILWEAVSSLWGLQGVGPVSVLQAIWRERDLFLPNAVLSVFEAVAGLALALMLAFSAAMVMSMSRTADRVLTPVVLAQQTIPLVAISPLLAAIIGEGLPAIIIITAWLCWFPAVIALNQGFLKVHPDRLALFRVARASRWRTFVDLRLPGAAGQIVSGVRASAGFALIGAIVTEYGGSQIGLGALIIQHVREIRPLPADALLGLVVVCAALGLLITWAAWAIATLVLRDWLTDDA